MTACGCTSATAPSGSRRRHRSRRSPSRRPRPGLPERLYEQLEPRGRLAVPVGGRWGQRLEVIVRSPEGPAIVHSVPCRFVPLVGEGGFDR